jgi:hypothetical protein
MVLKQGLTVIFFQLNTHHHEGGVVFNLLVGFSSLIRPTVAPRVLLGEKPPRRSVLSF